MAPNSGRRICTEGHKDHKGFGSSGRLAVLRWELRDEGSRKKPIPDPSLCPSCPSVQFLFLFWRTSFRAKVSPECGEKRNRPDHDERNGCRGKRFGGISAGVS